MHDHTPKNLGEQIAPPISHSLHEQMPQRVELETLRLGLLLVSLPVCLK